MLSCKDAQMVVVNGTLNRVALDQFGSVHFKSIQRGRGRDSRTQPALDHIVYV